MTDLGVRFNADAGSNYATRNSINGAADVTSTNQTSLANTNQRTSDIFNKYYLNSQATLNKLGITFTVDEEATGAATIPSRTEGTHKWANIISQITQIQNLNTGAGDYLTDSNLSWFTGLF